MLLEKEGLERRENVFSSKKEGKKRSSRDFFKIGRVRARRCQARFRPAD